MAPPALAPEPGRKGPRGPVSLWGERRGVSGRGGDPDKQLRSALPSSVWRNERGRGPVQSGRWGSATYAAASRARAGNPATSGMRSCYLLRNASSVGRVSMSVAAGTPYIVRSVVHASEVLRAFRSSGEALRLRDVVERTGLGKGLCFRLLHTLHHIGLVEKVDA